MSDKNLFEIAARKQFRYPSTRGELTTEQLFTLPLLSRSNFDLNNVAVAVNNDLKALAEESFVSTKSHPGKADLEAKLEIVKHIIAVRQEEAEKARLSAEKAAQREKLVQALANQEDKALQNLSVDEIRAKLAELDN